MNPNETPSREQIAATDALFESQPVQPTEPPADPGAAAAPPEPADSMPEPERDPSRPSPLGDYVRELQREFEEQDEEATIRLPEDEQP